MTNEEIFNKNINLAYRIANKYKINYQNEIEDIYQIALMGLWRSIQNWDHVHKLSTYAYTIISNDINMYLRHVKRNSKCIYILDNYIDNDKEIPLIDILEDPNDCIFDLVDQLDSKGVLDNIYLKENEKSVVRLRSMGLSQIEVAKILNTNQTQISRIQSRIKRKIKKYIDGNKD